MANENEKKTEKAPQIIKGAVILTPQLAQRIMAIFDEMPRRYSNIIDPVQAEILKSPQADVTLDDTKDKK